MSQLTILHISDLHIAGDLFVPSWGLPIKHRPSLLESVSNYWHSNNIDYLVVTGDISTDGEDDSLKSVHTFLTNSVTDTNVTSPSKKPIGLKLSDERFFVLPGNHDRYASRFLPIATQSKRFESVFGYRFLCLGRPRSAGWMTRDGFRIRVLTLDSMGAAGWTTAKGRVHEDDIDWLREVYEQDSRDQERYDLRLLLLHHHVAIPDNKDFKYLTKLKNREDLLEGMVRGDIDAVLFGHEHYRYAGLTSYETQITDKRRRRTMSKNGYRLEKQVIVGMCGTTTGQDPEAQNLAWLLKIEKKGSDRYRFEFDLMEVTDSGPSRTLQKITGAPPPFEFIRKPCRG